MKKDLHPKYQKCLVTCACGASFETRSTEDKLHVEICSQCHPFYTGKQKLVDTAGRVEQYIRKFEKSKKLQKATAQREKHQAKTPSGKAAAVETTTKAAGTKAAAAGTKAKAGTGAGKAKGKTS